MRLQQLPATDQPRSNELNRRRFCLSIALLCITTGLNRTAEPAAAGEDTLEDAIRLLTREKSAAEQYAVILGTVGKSDPPLYLHGLDLYSDAKAEFDGLVAELKFNLAAGQDPGGSARFAEALQGAAEKRVAFTSFVRQEVIDKVPGARPGLPDVLTAVPDLVKAITDAGLSIWAAFRDAGKQRREAILSEISQLEWRPFSDLVNK